jgi:hypothetical protein
MIMRVSDIPRPPRWFKIKNYSGVTSLHFRGWATQIGNRFFLGMLLDVSDFVEFDKHFARLMTDPLVDLGFNASAPSDKTLYSLTFGVAKAITDALSDTDCADNDTCDEKLRSHFPGMFDEQAHLYVNLRAPKLLLKQQFSEWIEQAGLPRSRGAALTLSKTSTWSGCHPILPYQDLYLWHKRHDHLLPSDSVMAEWLKLYGGDKDTARATRMEAIQAFTLANYFDLIHSASDSDPAST